MSFFFVHLSAAGSYSYTNPGGHPPHGPALVAGAAPRPAAAGGVAPGTLKPNPPTTKNLPLMTVPYSSSSGSGNGAAFDQRIPRAGGFCAPRFTDIAIATMEATAVSVSIRFRFGNIV